VGDPSGNWRLLGLTATQRSDYQYTSLKASPIECVLSTVLLLSACELAEQSMSARLLYSEYAAGCV